MTTVQNPVTNIPDEVTKETIDSHEDNDSDSNFPSDTPRSCESGDSSSLTTTPRGNLLWDHGYDVSDRAQDVKTFQERELEWRKFNKTDDDKLLADKQKDLDEEFQVNNKNVSMDTYTDKTSTNSVLSNNLPDLVSSMPSYFVNTNLTPCDGSLENNNQEEPNINKDDILDFSYNVCRGLDSKPNANSEISPIAYRNDDELLQMKDDIPPSLPLSNPPMLHISESPPPLPESDPPVLYHETVNDYTCSLFQEENSSEVKVNAIALIDKSEIGQIRNESTSESSDMDTSFGKEATLQRDQLFEDTEESVKSEPLDIYYQVNIGTGDISFESINLHNEVLYNDNERLANSTNKDVLINSEENDMKMNKNSDKWVLERDGLSENKKKELAFVEEAEKAFDEIISTAEYLNNSMESDGNKSETECDIAEKEQFDMEVEAEFEAIINALDLNYMDETYVERFADRRDRYGFILSPVIEAPSPTPSSLSGYSGLSSVSPDPLSMFRMSPRPGSRTDLDLSSLGIDPVEWDISPNNPVPIYQTVQAKRAVVIPDSYGWESGDDILSGSGEWEVEDGALKSPPISVSGVNLSQFGSHVVGWKQPDTVIVEEPESLSDDDNNQSESDSDETINGNPEDSSGIIQTFDDDRKDIPFHNDTDDDSVDGSNEELNSTLEDMLGKLTEMNSLSTEQSLDILTNGISQVAKEISSLREQTDIQSKESRKEMYDNVSTNLEPFNVIMQEHDNCIQPHSLESSTSDIGSIYHRTNSNVSNQTSDWRSTPDEYLDAEDEMSDTDEIVDRQQVEDGNSDTEFFLNKRESLHTLLLHASERSTKETDEEQVQVSEIVSPRTAVLLRGGMFPMQEDESTSSSSLESDSDEANYVIEKHLIKNETVGVKVTQLTSDDSDFESHSDVTNEPASSQKANNIVSFRGKYRLNTNISSPQEKYTKQDIQDKNTNSAISAPILKILSPLDLDLFGGMVEKQSLNDGGRSPRVLGRYFSEMDEDVLTQSLSPQTTGQTTHDIRQTQALESYSLLTHDEIDDNEFQDVILSHPTITEVGVEQGIDEDNISECSSRDSPEIPYILMEHNAEEQLLSNNQNPNVQKHTTETRQQGCELPVIIKNKKKTPPVTKSINRRNAKMNQQRSPVHISVSHLKRKDSLRNKIKKGFVHQISEIFSKKDPKDAEMFDIKHKERKPCSEFENVSLPELLTPNENIVIRQRIPHPSELNDFEDTKGGSLGFEVSPLLVISEHSNGPISHEEDLEQMEENKLTGDSSSTETRTETLQADTRIDNEIYTQREDNLIPNISRNDDENIHFEESMEFCDTSQSTESEVKTYIELLQELQDNVECISDDNLHEIEEKKYKQDEKISNNSENDTIESSICNHSEVQSNTNLTCKSLSDDFGLYKKWTKTNSIEYSWLSEDRDQSINDFGLYKKWSETSSREYSNKSSQIETSDNLSKEEWTTEIAKCLVEQKDCAFSLYNEDMDECCTGNKTSIVESNDKLNEEKLEINPQCETDLHQNFARKRTSPYKLKESYNTYDCQRSDGETIQYPPSLSRRLYGPYIRQRQRSPQPTTETPQIIERRETTPAALSRDRNLSTSSIERDSCQILNAILVVKPTVRDKPPDLSDYSVLQAIPANNTNGYLPTSESLSLTDECINTLPIQKYTKLDADNTTSECLGQNVNLSYTGDVFQHTLYKVDIPVTNPPTQGNVPFNLKPITHCVGNDARHLYHSQSNFANANIRSGDWSRAVNSDVNEENLQSKFSCVKTYNEIKSTGSCVNSCCDKSQNNLDFVHKCDSNISKEEKSVESELKNGIFLEKMGVTQTEEISTSDDTCENEKMRENGPLIQATSVERKVNSLSINDPTSKATVTVNQPYMSTGQDASRGENSQAKDRGKNSPPAWTRDKQVSVVVVPPDCQHVLEDEKGNVRVWPYSDFDNSDRLPVTLHKAKSRRKVLPFKGMNDNSSNMTIIQSAEHSTEMPENRMVQRYQTSTVLPTDNSQKSVTQTHTDSIKSVLLQDANGNMVSEEELAKILPKIAENIANMETTDAEEIVPGITQSVTKLRNGGNLVITTMTRKLDEIESDSSGRGSPEPAHPVLNVDDLDNSKIYLVEDSNGELFYVEDITSETQESAYFSSSRNTSESVSDGANSPTFKRISKIHQVGESGINNSTAEEILSAMYNGENVQEMTENEEEWSERTYEYDLPRRQNNGRANGYSKDTFNTSYVVEEPDTMPRTKTISKDRYETSYEMAENEPWVTDGGQMQSYSQAAQVQGFDRTDGASTVDTTDYSMRMNARQNASGSRTQESYTVEAEANVYPMVPYQFPIIQPPVFIPPAPVCIPAENPQYSLVKIDVKPQKEESVTSRVDVTEQNKVIEIDERPIFKTVAHIQTGEKHPPVKKDMTEKKYKIVSTKASNIKQEEQESHMTFGELDYRYTTENVEIKKSPTLQTKQFFVRDSTKLEQQKVKSEQRFRSEKTIDLGNRKPESARNNTTTIEVKRDYPMHDVETYEERTYSFDQMKASVEQANLEQANTDMRVIRGSYLIKNNLEEVDCALDDNINMFDGNFVLSKENPLYQSDEDIYKKFEREKAEHAQKQDRFQRDYRQDMTFETVDKFSKSKNVKREAAKPKQSVTELLLEKLSTIDSKDIHQRIDVKHHAEDIYGDPRFLHADGSSVRPRGTNDFDTVGEKVDLLLKEGKAFITVKVTAERITPVDLEFNVWRKNQAIVTRIIEVDLLATEQRRRLYYKVMDEQNDSPRGSGRRGYLAGPNETILDGHQTLDLFSRILGAAEGEGDKEDITVKTRLTNTTRPFSSGMDLLY